MPAVSGPATGRAARRGAVFGLSSQLARQVLSVIATVVLARLLTPADFGIVAAANTLLGVAVIGTMLGFAPAVVRRPDHDEAFVSTLFWTSVAVSAPLAAVMAVASPWLAAAFGSDDAALYLAVLAPALVCDVSASIPLAMLQRDLRFKALYGCTTGSMIVYVAVQVGLAFAGFGAWAVIIGQLSMSLTNLVGAMVLARWFPRPRFAAGVVRGELGFAGAFLVGQLMAYGLKTADYWAVGRTLGGTALGIYYIAFQLPSIVRLRMSSVSRQVLFPVFVREKESADQTSHIYRTTMRLQIGLGVPAMVGMAALAEPIVQVFFGSQWLAGVEPMRWLALAAMFEIITSPAGSIAIAHGRMRPYLVSLGLRLVLMVAVLGGVAAAGGGMEAFAIAMLVQSAGGAVITQVVLAHNLGLPAASVLAPLGLSVLPAAVMYAALTGLLAVLPDLPAVALLLMLVPLGVVVHVAALWVVSRRELDYLRTQAGGFAGALSGRRRRQVPEAGP
jgi:PST family polysaccharide transporter